MSINLPEVHKKVWGREIWIVNSFLYCAKILYLNKKYRCSYHFHKLKTETFYVFSGMVQMRLEEDSFIMYPGQVITILPGQKHSFAGLKKSSIFEIATQHFESDSYRDDKSGKI